MKKKVNVTRHAALTLWKLCFVFCLFAAYCLLFGCAVLADEVSAWEGSEEVSFIGEDPEEASPKEASLEEAEIPETAWFSEEPDGFSFNAGLSVISVPEASVPEASSPEEIHITEFLPLQKDYVVFAKPDLAAVLAAFPQTLQALTREGQQREVSVTWSPMGDYEGSAYYYYCFVPVLPEGCVLEGCELPYAVLWLEEERQEEEDSLVGDLKGSSNEEKVFYYLTEQMGLHEAAACGVLANIRAESNFEPDLGNLAYGLCQWTSDRKSRLISYCQEKGLSYRSLEGQLAYLDYELSSFYGGVLSAIKAVSNTADGAYEAGYLWCRRFEIPADLENQSQSRGRVARDTYWPRYGSLAGDTPPAEEDPSPGEGEPADENAPVAFGPWDGGGRTGISERNASIGQTITLRWGYCSETGMYLYDAGGNLLGKGTNPYYSYHVYFLAQEECGVTLTPGTTYRYLFYAIVNGKEYTGGAGSFTTRGTAPMEIEPRKVLLSFDAAGGSAVESMTLEAGEAVGRIPSTKRSGYTFLGWYTKENLQLTEGMTFDQDVTFTALWEKEQTAGEGETDEDEEDAEGLRLNPASVVLYVNTPADSKKLEVLWLGAPLGDITFSSSDKKIAKVSQKGKVTAKKKGKATITATVKTKGKTYTASCKVTVKKAKISAPSSLKIKKGTSSILGASVKPVGQLTFQSSDPSIATVNASGRVVGVKKGTCTITIESFGVTKKVTVKVKK